MCVCVCVCVRERERERERERMNDACPDGSLQGRASQVSLAQTLTASSQQGASRDLVFSTELGLWHIVDAQ